MRLIRPPATQPMLPSPFVPIEGSLALPRREPLSCVPPPFGRDWALQPSAASTAGAALPGAYAALFRTFCLDTPAFLAAWRWDHLRTPAAYAPASDPERQEAAAARSAVPVRTGAPQPPLPCVQPRARPDPRRHPWKQVRGGALKLGAAALLAGVVTWWLVGHLVVQRPSTTADVQAAAVSAPADVVAQPSPAVVETMASPVQPQIAATPAPQSVQPKSEPAAALARIEPPPRATREHRRAPQAAPSPAHGDSPDDVETLLRMEAAARADAATVPDLGIPVESTAWTSRLAHPRLTDAGARFAQ